MLRPAIIVMLLSAHPLHALSVVGGGPGVSPSDTTIVLSQASAVARRQATSAMKSSAGVLSWNMAHLDLMPRILGAADPIHYSQLLPGVQTNGEYRGGINVEGCDNSHSLVTIGGVPIYNTNHLLGIFSPFVATHYPAMTLRKSATTACHPSRLGAQMDFSLPLDPPSGGRRVEGEVEVGLLSSQGTLRLACTPRTTLTLSGRGSYINLLYSDLIRMAHQSIRYTFGDANATLSHRIGHHRLTLDAYFGQDCASMSSPSLQTRFASRWGNHFEALHWDAPLSHDSHLLTTVYHTAYSNRFSLILGHDAARLPSSIHDYALTSAFESRSVKAGIEAIVHDITEQYPYMSGSLFHSAGSAQRQPSLELTGYADYRLPLGVLVEGLRCNVGVRPSLFLSGRSSRYAALDPSVGVGYHRGVCDVAVSWSMRHQYLFLTGFSDTGFPSDFWLSSNAWRVPQWSNGVSVSAETWLFGRRLKLTADLYYKQIHHQQEYAGTVFSSFTPDYDLRSILRSGSGSNYGCSVMLNRPYGVVTGWLSYAFTRARRRFDSADSGVVQSFPASHERPHEVDAVVVGHLPRHFDLSVSFVAASGTPFTATRSISLLGGTIVSRYGAHNANRLPMYLRTDLSASYCWRSRCLGEQRVNVSVYNATARRNALFYSVEVDKGSRSFSYQPTAFFSRVLPSVSYVLKF